MSLDDGWLNNCLSNPVMLDPDAIPSGPGRQWLQQHPQTLLLATYSGKGCLPWRLIVFKILYFAVTDLYSAFCLAISILRAARCCCEGLLASPQHKQSCHCHPLGPVLSFSDPTKHDLGLSWETSGQVSFIRYLESFPQLCFLRRSLWAAQPAVPQPPRGLVCVRNLLCLATGPESSLPLHSSLELFKYLERVHFARAGISCWFIVIPGATAAFLPQLCWL